MHAACGGGRADTIVACGVGVIPFLHEWSTLISRGNCACGGKFVPLLQLHAIEREGVTGICETKGARRVGA